MSERVEISMSPEELEKRTRYLVAFGVALGANESELRTFLAQLFGNISYYEGISHALPIKESPKEDRVVIESLGVSFLNSSPNVRRLKYNVGQWVLVLMRETLVRGYFENLENYIWGSVGEKAVETYRSMIRG